MAVCQSDIDSLIARLSNLQLTTPELIDGNNATAFSIHSSYPELAAKYAQASLTASREIGYKKGEAGANNIIGVCQWVQGDFLDALERYFKARDVYLSIPDTLGYARTTLNISNVYERLFETKNDTSYERKSLEYSFKALNIFEASNSQTLIGASLNNIGLRYRKLGYHDSSEYYFKKALEIRLLVGDSRETAKTLNNLGLLYKTKSDLSKALDYFNRAYIIMKNLNDYDGLTMSLLNIGNVHLVRRKFDLAEKSFNEGMKYVDSIGSKMERSLYAAQLFDLEVARNNKQEALSYQQMHYEAEIVLSNASKDSEVEKLENSYELKQKETELEIASRNLELLNQTRKNELLIRYFLLLGIIILLVSAYIFFKMMRGKMIRDKEYEKAKQTLIKVDLENSEIKKQELASELEYKHRELTSYAINFIQKDRILEELRSLLDHIIKEHKSKAAVKHDLKDLQLVIRNNQSNEKDWKDFELYFEMVHPKFFERLKETSNDLNESDLRLCAMIRLNRNLKETASLLGYSANSIKTARYRLKKKLRLTSEQDLYHELMQLTEGVEIT